MSAIASEIYYKRFVPKREKSQVLISVDGVKLNLLAWSIQDGCDSPHGRQKQTYQKMVC